MLDSFTDATTVPRPARSSNKPPTLLSSGPLSTGMLQRALPYDLDPYR